MYCCTILQTPHNEDKRRNQRLRTLVDRTPALYLLQMQIPSMFTHFLGKNGREISVQGTREAGEGNAVLKPCPSHESPEERFYQSAKRTAGRRERAPRYLQTLRQLPGLTKTFDRPIVMIQTFFTDHGLSDEQNNLTLNISN